MKSIGDISEIPLLSNAERPVLGDVATIKEDTTYGENDNLGAIPVLSVTANLYNKDLGSAAVDVKKAIATLGPLPRGLTVEPIGMTQTAYGDPRQPAKRPGGGDHRYLPDAGRQFPIF